MPEQTNSLPRHVAVIMDGNGRWAKKRGLPRNMGHRKGAEVFDQIARHAVRIGIGYLTVYAFSTENWKRPPDEIAGIMNLLRSYLDDAEKYEKEAIRVRVIGDLTPLDAELRGKIREIEEKTRDKRGMTLNLAIGYGGRAEIVAAAQTAFQKLRDGRISQLDEQSFADCLFTAGQPDVDLLIRTSGEKRVSNFLLWQIAYAEMVFVDTFWPDFTPAHFDRALAEYAGRSRRLGGV